MTIQIIHGNGAIQYDENSGLVARKIDISFLLQLYNVPLKASLSLSERYLCRTVLACGVVSFAKIKHNVLPPIAVLNYCNTLETI
jgi:hypothetical protein